MKEIVGVHFHMEVISPDIQRAQFMAEQMNLSTYRAKKIQAYKDWADPVKRAAIQEETKALEAKSKTEIPTLQDQPWIRSEPIPYKIKGAVEE